MAGINTRLLNVVTYDDEDQETVRAAATEIESMRSKLDRYERLLATAYQLAGLVGAPKRFLNAYALHDDVDPDTLLPVTPDELDPDTASSREPQ